MANKNNNTATGFKYEPMPNNMYNEANEYAVRDRIDKLEDGFIIYLDKIRATGLIITSLDDLKKLTPDYVRKQIAETKKQRLQGSAFLPSVIRKREEQEFKDMESKLLPLVGYMQDLLKRIPVKIHLGAEAKDTYFDGEDVDKYIKASCTVEIPQEVRDYYDQIQKVCEAWQNLTEWALANGFNKPSMNLARKIIGEERCAHSAELATKEDCIFGLSPKEMFGAYLYGGIRRKQPDIEK